jgi:elongation factor Ts
MVEVNSQTDFVSRGDDFKAFVRAVVEVASRAKSGADLGAEKYPGSDKTVDVVRQELVAKTGENCVVRRWAGFDASEPTGIVHAYVHAGGKLAVLVHAEGPDPNNLDFKAFVDNVAMQVAAMNPVVVRRDQIGQGEIDKQREIFEAQLTEERKPVQAWPKIIEGKLGKWFTEVTLLGQDNVWDPPAGSIDKIRQELGKKLGGEVKIHAFSRFSLGEGIDKPPSDIAAEVAKTLGG